MLLSVLTALLALSPAPAPGKTLSLHDLLHNPDQHVNKKVTVEGQILRVCVIEGCWVELQQDDHVLRVRSKSDDLRFDKADAGNKATVTGKFFKVELSKEDAIKHFQHEAEEHGEEFDPSTVTEGVILYQIWADSIDVQ